MHIYYIMYVFFYNYLPLVTVEIAVQFCMAIKCELCPIHSFREESAAAPLRSLPHELTV